MNETASRYDLVPYASVPFRQSHPNRLATIATLMGLEPPPVARCRVLELGCGRGDNLIPLALQLPEAELVGIDLSPRHIELGREVIDELGVRNLRIEQGDILDLPADLGLFDYVIAHGVYSWLPDPVRDALMAATKRHLAPNGIAYVSYNTFPGWLQRSVARDALLFHTRSVQEPGSRIRESQAFIAFMGRVAPDSLGYKQLWHTLLDRIEVPEARDALLFHDFLEPDNAPVYFSHFVAHAGRHGLAFVAEARLADMTLATLGEEVAQRLSSVAGDVVTREQYRDFIVNRTFRQTLLCHDDLAPLAWPEPRGLDRMHVAGGLDTPDPERAVDDDRMMAFKRGDVEVGIDRPVVKAAMLELRAVWPDALPFGELLARARRRVRPATLSAVAQAAWESEERDLASELLQLHQADLVELDVSPPRFSRVPGERPRAYRWARRRAMIGEMVCNLRHNAIDLGELPTALLKLLDGSRDVEALAQALADAVERDGLVVSEDGCRIGDRTALVATLRERLPTMLERLAGLALIEVSAATEGTPG